MGENVGHPRSEPAGGARLQVAVVHGGPLLRGGLKPYAASLLEANPVWPAEELIPLVFQRGQLRVNGWDEGVDPVTGFAPAADCCENRGQSALGQRAEPLAVEPEGSGAALWIGLLLVLMHQQRAVAGFCAHHAQSVLDILAHKAWHVGAEGPGEARCGEKDVQSVLVLPGLGEVVLVETEKGARGQPQNESGRFTSGGQEAVHVVKVGLCVLKAMKGEVDGRPVRRAGKGLRNQCGSHAGIAEEDCGTGPGPGKAVRCW